MLHKNCLSSDTSALAPTETWKMMEHQVTVCSLPREGCFCACTLCPTVQLPNESVFPSREKRLVQGNSGISNSVNLAEVTKSLGGWFQHLQMELSTGQH